MSGRSRLRHVAACLAAVWALVLAASAAGAASAAAAPLPLGQCTTSSGVILAVDFSHWGGPLLRSCGSTPTTGYTLLNQGGWQSTGTQHDGPAFICRIGYAGYRGGTAYPTASDEACVLTPPATAYWSYWHAGPGQNTWTYSQVGSMSYHPQPGGVELWTFGATDVGGGAGQPPYSPDTVRAHNTAPTGGSGGTTASGGTSSGTSGGTSASGGTSGGTSGGAAAAGRTSGGSAAVGGSGTAGGATAPRTTTPAATTAPATTASASATPSGTTPSATTTSASPSPSQAVATTTGGGSAQPRAQDAEPTAAAGHSSGSMLPAAITAAVLAVIAGLVVLRIRQRRRNT